MRDDIMIWHCLSLAEPIPRMIPKRKPLLILIAILSRPQWVNATFQRVAAVSNPDWLKSLITGLYLQHSPAAPFLTHYYPDGVGMSAFTHIRKAQNGKAQHSGEINSLVTGWCGRNLENKIFKLIVQNNDLSTQSEMTLQTLRMKGQRYWFGVRVMAWCHQATSHYLHQCWPRFMSSIHHMALLGLNELTHWGLNQISTIL